MAKYKIERSRGRTLLVIAGQKGDQLSEREFYAITTMQMPCLVKADIVRKSKTFKLLYDISGFIPLREYLMNPLSKKTFSQLLKGILDNLKILQRAYFEERYLLLDVNTVMVNPLNQELKFIFVPISFYGNSVSLKNFLLSIIDSCTFVQGESGDYVREYIRILNNGINFSVFDLEEYVRRLNSDSPENKHEKKCNKCGAVIGYNVNFCSLCGTRIGEIVVNNDNVYDPSKIAFRQVVQAVTVPDIPTSVPPNSYNAYGVAGIPASSPENSSGYSSGGSATIPAYTGNGHRDVSYGDNRGQINSSLSSGPETHGRRSVPPDFGVPNGPINETAVIPQLYGKQVFLVDAVSGEKVAVNSQVFSIGKDRSNSFCIENNSAVSRKHAVIKNVNGRWMLSDANSTNHTYANGNRVMPGQDVEIFNNTKITFANADYIFLKY